MQRLTCLLMIALAVGEAGAATTNPPMSSPLPAAAPQSQGFSPQRLERLHAFMRGVVDTQQYRGAVVLIARNGRIVDWSTYGHRDVAATSAMPRDAIFQIFSMTKTLTSVAALMLMEEGALNLEDPVSRYLPEFAGLQVFVGGTVEAPQLRAPVRPLTIRHLLTHTSGFATGAKDPEQAQQLLRAIEPSRSPDLKTYAEKVARAPLGADPGSRFAYDGVSTEVLSRLIEVVSGVPFETFLQKRLIEPLKLKDTGFSVPSAHRARVVEMSATDASGRLIRAPKYPGGSPGERLNAYASGAGGLYSTAGDYLRFCQMLMNGGELDGVSILGRKTEDLMMSNHLTQLDPPVNEFSDGEGFGLGGYVVLDVARRGRPGSVGQFGWSGAGGTYYTLDRQEQLIALLMTQHQPQGLPSDPPKISFRFYNLVYQSLVR